MPDRDGPKCAICSRRTAANWTMCKKHSLEYAEFNKRPPWVKYMVNEEKTRRYRITHTKGYKREFSESSLDNILEHAYARSGERGEDDFWYEMQDKQEYPGRSYTDDMDDQKLEADGYAIEVLGKLNCDELNLVLLRNALEFSLPQIGQILGVSYGAAWRRWAQVKKRLTEVKAELEAADAIP